VHSGEARPYGRTQHRFERLVAALAGVGVAVFVAIAAFTAVPPVLQNLSTTVADGTTAYPVRAAEGPTVLVPADWLVQRRQNGALGVLTPDGVLAGEVSVATGDPAEVLSAWLVEEGVTPTGPVLAEVLTGGSRLVHVDAADVVYAVVATDDAAVVRVVAHSTGDPRAYRPALSELLTGVRP